MTVRFAHDSKVTVKIKLYVTARGEGIRFNYIDEIWCRSNCIKRYNGNKS